MQEISHLLEIDQGGLVTFDSHAAYGEQVRLWLNTPKGEYWGRPGWGNPFVDFKYVDPTEDSCIEMELIILSALKRDLPNVPVADVVVTLSSKIDKQTFTVSIVLSNETVTKEIAGGLGDAA
ncbi:hypothetical protein NTE19_003367 [Vibrio fluvialis]|nr:hypothetical protein [Vibrio fluvialis]